MFEVFYLMFSWLPSPLPEILFGAVCLLLLFALIKLVAKIIELLPFI